MEMNGKQCGGKADDYIQERKEREKAQREERKTGRDGMVPQTWGVFLPHVHPTDVPDVVPENL
jgi:hypothetical protein